MQFVETVPMKLVDELAKIMIEHNLFGHYVKQIIRDQLKVKNKEDRGRNYDSDDDDYDNEEEKED